MEEENLNTEIRALISFLDETDEQIVETVRNKIILKGRAALPLLEEALHITLDERALGRIRKLLGSIRKEAVRKDFSAWITGRSSDLLKAYLIISRIEYPEIKEEDIEAQIERIRLDAWLELNDNLTALENIRVLNHIFFQLYQFVGNKDNGNAPQEQYLPYLLESRTGSSLSLGILYLIIANRLNIPLSGVNLPEYFILAYLDDNGAQNNEDGILFYINPFKGSVFTKREIEMFLKQLKIKANMKFFNPCSNLDVIIRLLNDLKKNYEETGNISKAEELDRLLELTDL